MKHAWIPILAALILIPSSSQAQVTGQHLDRTTAALGAASGEAGKIYMHTQGADNTDCGATGGGSIRVPCYSDGTTWLALSPDGDTVFTPTAGVSTDHGAGAITALTDIGDICAGDQILERNTGDTAWACIATPSGGGGSPGGVSGDVQINDGASGFAASLMNDDGADVTLGSGRVLLPDGTSSLPSLSFSAAGQQDVGFYRDGTNVIGLALGDGISLDITRVSDIKLIFSNDSDTYFRWISSNKLDVHAGGSFTVWEDNAVDSVQTFTQGRLGQSVQSSLTPAAASASFMDDGTSQQVHIAGTATQADNVFEVDLNGNGTVDLWIPTWTDPVILMGHASATNAYIGVYADGDYAAPEYTFTVDTNTGYMRSGVDTTSVVGGAMEIARFSDTVASTNDEALFVFNAGTEKGVAVRADASQTVDVFVVEDPAGVDDFTVEADGDVVVGTGVLRLTPKASAPGTCVIGDFYVDTSGAYCACSVTNTWENMTATGACT